MDNYGGYIYINNKSFSINTSNSNHVINSFSIPLAYNFSIERLPLDDLLDNNSKVNSSRSCTKMDCPWLNCLNSETKKVIIPRCDSNHKLYLSYTNNKYKSIYESNSNLTISNPTIYQHTINLKCKMMFILIFNY